MTTKKYYGLAAKIKVKHKIKSYIIMDINGNTIRQTHSELTKKVHSGIIVNLVPAGNDFRHKGIYMSSLPTFDENMNLISGMSLEAIEYYIAQAISQQMEKDGVKLENKQVTEEVKNIQQEERRIQKSVTSLPTKSNNGNIFDRISESNIRKSVQKKFSKDYVNKLADITYNLNDYLMMSAKLIMAKSNTNSEISMNPDIISYDRTMEVTGIALIDSQIQNSGLPSAVNFIKSKTEIARKRIGEFLVDDQMELRQIIGSINNNIETIKKLHAETKRLIDENKEILEEEKREEQRALKDEKKEEKELIKAEQMEIKAEKKDEKALIKEEKRIIKEELKIEKATIEQEKQLIENLNKIVSAYKDKLKSIRDKIKNIEINENSIEKSIQKFEEYKELAYSIMYDIEMEDEYTVGKLTDNIIRLQNTIQEVESKIQEKRDKKETAEYKKEISSRQEYYESLKEKIFGFSAKVNQKISLRKIKEAEKIIEDATVILDEMQQSLSNDIPEIQQIAISLIAESADKIQSYSDKIAKYVEKQINK